MLEFMNGVIGFFSMWPLPFETTVALGAILYKSVDFIWNKQWKKLEKVVMEEAMPLFSELMSNEEKRDKVVIAVWNSMPKPMRALATAEQVEKFVDLIYNTQVKPKAKREGVYNASKMEEPLMRIGFDENNNIIEEVNDFFK